ncbi:serine carboxypeptidase-like 35 isoform X1 [Vigna radiata var. radiata]|uniref:Serine carboxypeptidase-like 35 isoform X1 n=1 Tax=Vigna radiata var. radiata TaxID=3916 RepID=A0A3Q0FGI7_VIGRR|nr:serine carboxypeptidase-like 35 isoform X1 [Vigna radiata var. radiata]
MEDDKMTIASHVKLRSEEEEKALFSWIFGVQEVSSRKTPVFGLNGGNKNGPYINLNVVTDDFGVTEIQMGNALINDATDLRGVFDFALYHAIISKEVHDGIRDNCDFRTINQTRECSWNVAKFLKAYSDIDIFNIYSPVCLLDFETQVSSTPDVAHYTVSKFDFENMIPTMAYDPCKVNEVKKYFNRKDVQKAIHAWFPNMLDYTVCSNKITKWNDSPTTVLP